MKKIFKSIKTAQMIKAISLILLIIQLITITGNFKNVNAQIKEGDTLLLQGDHECDSLVEYQMPSGWWSYKIVWYVYYKDLETENKYPAFCVEPAKEGVGTGYTEYNTTISKETDNSIWRILSKGYMGSSYKSWNLECDDDLYSATKIALHSYKEGINPEGKYIIGNRSVDGNTVEEIQRRGTKVLDVAEELYNYGKNGSEGYTNPKVSINKEGNYEVQEINEEKYYIQNYKVSSNKYLKSYKVSINNFTSNTKILNSNNEIIHKDIELKNDLFKIAIPLKEIKEGIKGQININEAQVKTCPVYYAKSWVSNAQSYVTYTSGYEETNAITTLNIDPNNASLKITKYDEETKQPIKDVTFEIKYEDESLIGNFTTDEKGIIQVNNLKPVKVKIKEIQTDDIHILNLEEKEVELEWGSTHEIQIGNERKKASIKIIKCDSEDENIKLKDVEFEIYNEEKELIKTVVTNEKGEVIIENLDVGKYIIKETKTNENYYINENELDIVLKENGEVKILNITNKPKEKLPRTGF